MLLIEGMRLVQMFTLEKAPLDAMKQTHANQTSHPVVGVVASERRQHQQRHQQIELQRIQAAQSACDKQQRIARQKRSEYQTCLGEDDQEQDTVYPYTVVLHQGHQMRIQMQNEINKSGQQFQRQSISVRLKLVVCSCQLLATSCFFTAALLPLLLFPA